MAEVFLEILTQLKDPVPTRRYQALESLQRPENQDVMKRFCRKGHDTSLSNALALCPILSTAKAPPLLDLLRHYAARSEASLRERALKALGEVDPDLRNPRLLSLLHEYNPEVRAAACGLLGGVGALGARDELIACFQDKHPQVVLAALKALERLDAYDAATEIAALLDRETPQIVTLAIEVLVELAHEDSYPQDKIITLLADSKEEDIRRTACWALQKRPSRAAEKVLVKILTSNAPPTLRSAAANALSEIENPAAVRTLMIQAARDKDIAVGLNCKRALNNMNEEIMMTIARELLEDEDPFICMETASILGNLSFTGARDLLLNKLRSEKDPIVLSAVIEALGRGGWSDTWDDIRRLVCQDPIVGYPAVNALGDLMDREHLNDFARLLNEVDNPTQREAILKRLALYGRANGLPAELSPLLIPYFHSPDTNTAMMAFEAAGYVDDEPLAAEILCAMGPDQQEPIRQVAARSAASLCEGNLYHLLTMGGPESIPQLTNLIKMLNSLGREGIQLCHYLAQLAADGNLDATNCLKAAAETAVHEFSQALNEATEEEAEELLKIWQKLPRHIRSGEKINLAAMLSHRSRRVQIEALNAIDGCEESTLLSEVAGLAIASVDKDVQNAARLATRRLVECHE